MCEVKVKAALPTIYLLDEKNNNNNTLIYDEMHKVSKAKQREWDGKVWYGMVVENRS